MMKMNMDIEDQKDEFLELLRSSYGAQRALSADDPFIVAFLTDTSLKRGEHDVFIKENILCKYEFGDTDFWEIICPALKAEGWIESFKNPNIVSAEDKDDHYEHFPQHRELVNEIVKLTNS